MSFKPIDGKRDEFRKYLERTGVLDAICKVLIKLLNSPERPENAVEFIRDNLGVSLNQANTIEQLTNELEDARNEIAQLKRSVEALTAAKTKDVLEQCAVPPSVIQTSSATPTAKEQEESPSAVADKANTEVPTPPETVQSEDPAGNLEQESKPVAVDAGSPSQEGGGN